MILVDTSLWINYFNGIKDERTDLLDQLLIDGVAAIGDLILLELLQGFRHDKHYRTAKATLNALPQYELFGHSMVEKCAKNYRALRKKGITIRRTNDVIIATFCIEHRMPLLFSDKDFLSFVEYLGLQSALAGVQEK